MYRNPIVFALALFMILTLCSGNSFAKKKTKKTAEATKASVLVHYSGDLKTRAGGTLGGIFPIKFSLFKAERSRKASWTETHWVAVDYGRYSVVLGNINTIPKKLNMDKVFIGVEIVGRGEVLRERFVVAGEPIVKKPIRQPVSNNTPATNPKGKRVENAEFAEKAEFAYNAGDAQKLSGMTVEDLQAEFATPVKVGKKIWTSRSVGGVGGDEEFELRCPKGQIAIGIRGMEGKFIDSMKLICAAIE
jgi:hypothetical protein